MKKLQQKKCRTWRKLSKEFAEFAAKQAQLRKMLRELEQEKKERGEEEANWRTSRTKWTKQKGVGQQAAYKWNAQKATRNKLDFWRLKEQKENENTKRRENQKLVRILIENFRHSSKNISNSVKQKQNGSSKYLRIWNPSTRSWSKIIIKVWNPVND